jgi:serine/threonine-protein kinase RsbW
MATAAQFVPIPPAAPREGWQRASLRTFNQVAAVVDRVGEFLAAAGFPDRDRFSVRLALEEAIVNAIKHGHQGDPNKEVRVAYAVAGCEFWVTVEDEGPGFKPDELPDPLAPENLERSCGRGVFLIGHYMTHVEYNERGNRVTMSKRRA